MVIGIKFTSRQGVVHRRGLPDDQSLRAGSHVKLVNHCSTSGNLPLPDLQGLDVDDCVCLGACNSLFLQPRSRMPADHSQGPHHFLGCLRIFWEGAAGDGRILAVHRLRVVDAS